MSTYARLTGGSGAQDGGGRKTLMAFEVPNAPAGPIAAARMASPGTPSMRRVPPLTPPFPAPGGIGDDWKPTYRKPVVFWTFGLTGLVMVNSIQFQRWLLPPGGATPAGAGYSVPNMPSLKATALPLPSLL